MQVMSLTDDIELVFRGITSFHTYSAYRGVHSYYQSRFPNVPDLQHFSGHGKKAACGCYGDVVGKPFMLHLSGILGISHTSYYNS